MLNQEAPKRKNYFFLHNWWYSTKWSSPCLQADQSYDISEVSYFNSVLTLFACRMCQIIQVKDSVPQPPPIWDSNFWLLFALPAD